VFVGYDVKGRSRGKLHITDKAHVDRCSVMQYGSLSSDQTALDASLVHHGGVSAGGHGYQRLFAEHRQQATLCALIQLSPSQKHTSKMGVGSPRYLWCVNTAHVVDIRPVSDSQLISWMLRGKANVT
jgi:hypothetical protein